MRDRITVLLATGLFALPLVACPRGERASMGCPDDESCSDLTPEGLYFTGASSGLFRGSVDEVAVAVGGTSRLTFDPVGDYALPDFEVRLARDVATAEQRGDDGAVVTGVAEGTDRLRVTERGNELLLDRIPVRVGRIDRARLFPALGDVDAVFLVGTPIDVYVLFDDVSGRPLDDDSLVVTSGFTQAEDYPPRATGPAMESAGTYEVAVTAGEDESFEASYEVVDAIDGVAFGRAAEDVEVEVGRFTSVCAHATHTGREVVGPTVTLTLDGTAAIFDPLLPPAGGCASLVAESVGTTTVTATSGPFTATLVVNVVPADASTSPLSSPRAPTEQPTSRVLRGERAMLSR